MNLFYCRQESFQRAVFNAKAKAQSIAQAVGVQLGPATQVIETSQDVADEPSTPRGSRGEVLETVSRAEGVQQTYTRETITYMSSVAVTFEAHPILLRTCTHNKCPKH